MVDDKNPIRELITKIDSLEISKKKEKRFELLLGRFKRMAATLLRPVQ
jgi:hypothetical protein